MTSPAWHDEEERQPRLRHVRHRPRVLIAGGGVAGLEALIALRRLTDGLVDLVLLAPETQFAYRPLSVAEPFGAGEIRRFDLATVLADHGAHHHRDALHAVDGDGHRVITRRGEEIPYDVLLVALGARHVEAVSGALTFGGPAAREPFAALLAQLEAGEVERVVFAVPGGASWPLPAYELALMTAARMQERGVVGARLSLVTPEARPLEVFGRRASEAVAGLLAERGVEIHTGHYPRAVHGRTLEVVPFARIDADRVVSLPVAEGPGVEGLPSDPDGFLPADPHGRVRGVEDVYAAGDVTTFPIKQGGIAAQQADAAARSIASQLGAAVKPEPFRPVLRGLLLTGAAPEFLREEIIGGHGESSTASHEALWWPPGKIAAPWLAPYLAERVGLDHRPLADREPAGERSRAGAEHRAAVDLALALADAEAGWDDQAGALRALDVAESLDGMLPEEYAAKRRRWEAQAPGRRRR
jgi:sulfide:quinone oxidoreductase